MVIIVSIILLCIVSSAKGQDIILFWNVENYFDPFDDPNTSDEDFTVKGYYHWTWKRFERKRNAIAKTIVATGDRYGRAPVLVGLAEVENRMVINQLITKTVLRHMNYGIVHQESPDPRGIDVALLYDKKRFLPLYKEFIKVKGISTREILYVKGIMMFPNPSDSQIICSQRGSFFKGAEEDKFPVNQDFNTFRVSGIGRLSRAHQTNLASFNTFRVSGIDDGKKKEDFPPFKAAAVVSDRGLSYGDTVHIFVNHWPSKRGGIKESNERRLAAARALMSKTDSIFKSGAYCSKMLIMGDLNDVSEGDAVSMVCRDSLSSVFIKGKGSIKYKGKWEFIDHFIVSQDIENMILDAEVFSPSFLLEEDKTFLGMKPFRTYIGPRYNAGVSDHLPIVVKILFNSSFYE